MLRHRKPDPFHTPTPIDENDVLHSTRRVSKSEARDESETNNDSMLVGAGVGLDESAWTVEFIGLDDDDIALWICQRLE